MAPEIYQLSASQLKAALEARELSSEEVVKALLARHDRLDSRINAFVHLRQEILTEAKAADAARRRGDTLGPLHGIPISLKENIAVAGLSASLGLRARADSRATRDAVIVHELKQAGALILGQTNVPQLLLAQETENAIYGRTNNPWNLERTPGGSSGGEAAAIAAGMSYWGIGTDIGGSIRGPAHFCGIAGLKPTLDRWSNRGSSGALVGQELVRSQLGPMARTVADLELLWSALDPIRQAERDPFVPPLPATSPDSLELDRLTIGVFAGDPYLEPSRSQLRAVEMTQRALETTGVTVKSYQPVRADEVLYTWLAGVSSDGGRTVETQLKGETISPQLKSSRGVLRLPGFARKAIAEVMQRRGEHRVAELLRSMGEKTVQQYWSLTAKRTELRHAELDAWSRAGIDVLVCPVHVVSALPHGSSGDFTLSLGAQMRWTLLNFPAGVVPVTRVRDDEIGHYPDDGDRIERKIANIDNQSTGLPVGVQIVARPFQEHKALRVMRLIEDHARTQAGFPHTPTTPE